MKPAARGDTVGDVGELVRAINLDKVLENGRLDEIRMKLSNSVDLVRADNGQKCHAHHLGLRLLNDRHTSKDASVVGKRLFDLLKEEQINVVDNLQVPRKEVLEQANGPFLQSLGKDRVVGVAELRGGLEFWARTASREGSLQC